MIKEVSQNIEKEVVDLEFAIDDAMQKDIFGGEISMNDASSVLEVGKGNSAEKVGELASPKIRGTKKDLKRERAKNQREYYETGDIEAKEKADALSVHISENFANSSLEKPLRKKMKEAQEERNAFLDAVFSDTQNEMDQMKEEEMNAVLGKVPAEKVVESVVEKNSVPVSSFEKIDKDSENFSESITEFELGMKKGTVEWDKEMMLRKIIKTEELAKRRSLTADEKTEIENEVSRRIAGDFEPEENMMKEDLNSLEYYIYEAMDIPLKGNDFVSAGKKLMEAQKLRGEEFAEISYKLADILEPFYSLHKEQKTKALEVVNFIVKADEKEKAFSADELRKEGFDDEMVQAYFAMRKYLNEVFKMHLVEMVRFGKTKEGFVAVNEKEVKQFVESVITKRNEKKMVNGEYVVVGVSVDSIVADIVEMAKMRGGELDAEIAELEGQKASAITKTLKGELSEAIGKLKKAKIEMIQKRIANYFEAESRVDGFFLNQLAYMPHKWEHRFVVKKLGSKKEGQWKTQEMVDFKTEKEQRKYFEQMRSENTDADVFYQMDTLDSIDVDFFTKQRTSAGFMTSILEQTNAMPEVKMMAEQALKELSMSKGFGRHYLRRAKVKGYDTDAEVVLKNVLDFGAGFSGMVSKHHSAPMYFESLELVDAKRQKKLHDWVVRQIDFEMGDSAEFAKTKSVMFAYFLANDPSYLLLNMTQNLIVGSAEISKLTDGLDGVALPEKEFVKAWKDVLPMRKAVESGGVGDGVLDRMNVSESERLAIFEMIRLGHLGADITADFSGMKNNPLYQTTSSILSKAIFASNGVLEMYWNRIPAFLVARRLLEKRNEKLSLGISEEQINERALEISNSIHFLGGKANKPIILRSFAGLLFMYQKFPLSIFKLLARNAKNKQYRAVARTMIYTMIFGGVRALPVASLLFLAYSALFGDGDDEEEKEQDALLYRFFNAGVINTLSGMDMSSRVQLGLPIVSPFVEMFLGEEARMSSFSATFAFAQRLYKGVNFVDEGRYAEAVANLLPDFIGNFARAYVGNTQGVTMKSGKRLPDPETGKPFRYTLPETIMKSAGFSSERERQAWNAFVGKMKKNAEESDEKGGWTRRIRGALLENNLEDALNIEMEYLEKFPDAQTNRVLRDVIKEEMGLGDANPNGIKNFSDTDEGLVLLFEMKKERPEWYRLYFDRSSDEEQKKILQYAMKKVVQNGNFSAMEELEDEFSQLYPKASSGIVSAVIEEIGGIDNKEIKTFNSAKGYEKFSSLSAGLQQEFLDRSTPAMRENVGKWKIVAENPTDDPSVIRSILMENNLVKEPTSGSVYAWKKKALELKGVSADLIPPMPKRWDEFAEIPVVKNPASVKIFHTEKFKALSDDEKAVRLKGLVKEGKIPLRVAVEVQMLSGKLDYLQLQEYGY